MRSPNEPLSDTELDEIRAVRKFARTAFYNLPQVSPQEHDLIERALTGGDRLLAEVDRLRELKCVICGSRVAHLNYAGYIIGWGCADGGVCNPNPVEAERDALAARLDAVLSLILDSFSRGRSIAPASDGCGEPGLYHECSGDNPTWMDGVDMGAVLRFIGRHRCGEEDGTLWGAND